MIVTTQDGLPFYLQARLRSTWQEVRALAEQKGLQHAFEMDLFALERSVSEVLASGDQVAARRALDRAREMLARLQAASGKGDPLLLR